MKRTLLQFTVVAAILLLAAGCGPAEELAEKPNVILISVDSLRADHVGAYGYARSTSPHIDALAEESVLFENAVSTTSWTLPAHISMLTSRFSEAHGVTGAGDSLAESAITLPEIFQDGGYATAAVVSGPFLNRRFGFSQGFDVYDDETVSFAEINDSHQGVTSPLTHGRALEILDDVAGEPFFLFLHYWDVHYDYSPPSPYDEMFDPDYTGSISADNFIHDDEIQRDMDPRDLEHVVALYDGEIAYTDFYMGELFAELKRRDLWDNTLIVLTSDHGDEFFEHGNKGHRNTLYGELLNVPLIVKLPQQRRGGERLRNLAGIVDIAPTMLEVAGLQPLSGANGESLLNRMSGSIEGSVASSTGGSGDSSGEAAGRVYFADVDQRVKSVVSEAAKLIAHWRREPGEEMRVELYDLNRDPGEQLDLSTKDVQQVVRLRRALQAWVRSAREQVKHLGESGFEQDPELMRTLRSLGYIQ
jgi:arylsulfatase A-like enzyme